MFGVGMLGSYITQGVYTVASPFQPFGGAVDIIVVEQEDGTFKSSPWFVKFGKFQGVLKRKENTVDISVNDVPTDFHMYLDHKGEAYFEKEVESDYDTILSPPSAPSSGDEKAEYVGTRLLTNSKVVTVEGIEMQEAPNKGMHMDMKIASISNDDDNPNSRIEQVNSDSTVLGSGALVNQDETEVLIAISENGSHQGEGERGTICGSKAMLEKGESKSKRLGKAGSKPSRSLFGYVFGEKSQHVSGIPSASEHQGYQSTAENSKSRLFLERARIAADLLDKRWGSARKEVSPSPRGKTSAPESLGPEGSQLEETGLMHVSENPVIALNEASFLQSEPLELPGPRHPLEGFEGPNLDKLTSEIADAEDLQVNRVRLEKSMSEEDLFLRSAVEEEALVLLLQKSLGDGSLSNEYSYDPIHENLVQTVRYNAEETGSGEAVCSGMVGHDRDQETESRTCPDVVLMSVDGHIITAPVNSESSQVNESGLSFDEGKRFSVVYDVQARGPSLVNSELIEFDRHNRGEQVDVVTDSSSMTRRLEVDVYPGLNQPSAAGESVMIDEVPAGSSDFDIDVYTAFTSASASEAFAFRNEKDNMTSLEVTPEIYLNGKFEDPKGTAPVIFQSTQVSPDVSDMRAVGQILERCEACVTDDIVVPNCTMEVHGNVLESEAGVRIDTSGPAAGCTLDGSIMGIEVLLGSGLISPLASDKWGPKHVEMFPEVVLSGQSAKLSLGVVESSGKQGLEHRHCFREGSTVDLDVETFKENIFENCVALEELPSDTGNENARAVSKMNDSGFEVVHEGNIFSSSEDVGLPMSEELPANIPYRISTMGISQPIAVPPCEIEKRVGLPSSASLPVGFYETERTNCERFYSHSVGSSPLLNTQHLHLEPDINGSSRKGLDGGLSWADRKTIVAIVYGSRKDSAEVLDAQKSSRVDVDLSLCRHFLSEGMGAEAAGMAFESQKISYEEFQRSGSTIVADDKLVVKIGGRYFSWVEAEPYILGMVAFGSEAHKMEGGIAIEASNSNKDAGSQTVATVPSPARWNLWPFSLRRSGGERSPLSTSTISKEALLAATGVAINSPFTKELLQNNGYYERTRKKRVHTYVPTSVQLASLKLKDGSNKVTFTFSTGVVGKTQVDARIYLWKWNTRIVVSDVDGTITKSDVLGQVMPLVGRDWSQSGVTRLFSAIKENGYELLFLSARAISQAYLTRQFLLNLKQDGETLPDGPMFISPDGLIPSLYREVIRRAPHEFKIACLERIRELFPSDVNPFYAGFGNRNTDEISYLKVGVPKGKVFTINPKGEVAVNHRVDVRSYTSLHKLVDDMFPAMSSREQEDFNSWNYWKLPLPDVEDDLIVNSARSKKKGGDSTKKGGIVKR